MRQQTNQRTDQEENLSQSHEALWIKQLYREFEDIVWYHKVPLRLPVIQIADMGCRWGQWDPFFRTITLSTKLILSYRWDIVLEVLKHEMAHQYVEEVYGARNAHHHGELFKKACERLGVAAWAMSAAGELPDAIPSLRERVIDSEDARLLDRAEKLLALAQSSNEHEALLAMTKVRELYARHDFERLRVKAAQSHMDSLTLCRKRQRMEPHESMIYTILNDHFFVKVIHTSLYDPRDLIKYKAVELMGTRQNLLMAEYVFHFLLQQCDFLWRQHQKTTGQQARLRRSYLLGVLHGFSEKLALQNVTSKVTENMGITASEAKALMVQGKNELQDYVAHRYPRIATKSQNRARVNGAVFSAGKSDGRSINLSKAVGENARRFGGFLR